MKRAAAESEAGCFEREPSGAVIRRHDDPNMATGAGVRKDFLRVCSSRLIERSESGNICSRGCVQRQRATIAARLDSHAEIG